MSNEVSFFISLGWKGHAHIFAQVSHHQEKKKYNRVNEMEPGTFKKKDFR